MEECKIMQKDDFDVKKFSELFYKDFTYLDFFKKCGEDVRIDEWARITRPDLLELGSHISIDAWVYMSIGGKLHDWIHIAPSVSVIGGSDSHLVMYDFTSVGSGSRLICASDDFNDGFLCPFIPKKYRHVINKPIIFERFSGVGVNCTIMPGITIGTGAVVGGGSIVTKDIEPWTINVGSPSKPIGYRKKDLILKGAKEMGYEYQ